MRDSLSRPVEWPGKDRMLANLALYELIDGRDAEGIARLHEAQVGFETHAQWEDLAFALANEAAYLRVKGKKDEAELTQRHADEISRRANLPQTPMDAH